jgi:hypothetical protein
MYRTGLAELRRRCATVTTHVCCDAPDSDSLSVAKVMSSAAPPMLIDEDDEILLAPKVAVLAACVVVPAAAAVVAAASAAKRPRPDDSVATAPAGVAARSARTEVGRPHGKGNGIAKLAAFAFGSSGDLSAGISTLSYAASEDVTEAPTAKTEPTPPRVVLSPAEPPTEPRTAAASFDADDEPQLAPASVKSPVFKQAVAQPKPKPKAATPAKGMPAAKGATPTIDAFFAKFRKAP